jgi:hypothetical protein
MAGSPSVVAGDLGCVYGEMEGMLWNLEFEKQHQNLRSQGTVLEIRHCCRTWNVRRTSRR